MCCAPLRGEEAKTLRLKIPGEFEFRIDGPWKITEPKKGDFGFMTYAQGKGEIAKEERFLIYSAVQITDPSKIKDPKRRNIDAKWMVEFMVKSMVSGGKQGGDDDPNRSEPTILQSSAPQAV